MRYIKVSENGSILQDMMTSEELSPPWVPVPKPERVLLNRELYQIRWDGEHIVEKSPIQLVVGAKAWPADGTTPNAICIRGDIAPDHKVHLAINGEGYDVSMNDDALLTSAKPGQYVITMDDPLYYCVPPTTVLMALTQEDYEEWRRNGH